MACFSCPPIGVVKMGMITTTGEVLGYDDLP